MLLREDYVIVYHTLFFSPTFSWQAAQKSLPPEMVKGTSLYWATLSEVVILFGLCLDAGGLCRLLPPAPSGHGGFSFTFLFLDRSDTLGARSLSTGDTNGGDSDDWDELDCLRLELLQLDAAGSWWDGKEDRDDSIFLQSTLSILSMWLWSRPQTVRLSTRPTSFIYAWNSKLFHTYSRTYAFGYQLCSHNLCLA